MSVPSAHPIPATLNGCRFAWAFDGPRGVYTNLELEYFLKDYGVTIIGGSVPATLPHVRGQGLTRWALTGRLTDLGAPPGKWGPDEDALAENLAVQLCGAVSPVDWDLYELVAVVPANFSNPKTVAWAGYADVADRSQPPIRCGRYVISPTTPPTVPIWAPIGAMINIDPAEALADEANRCGFSDPTTKKEADDMVASLLSLPDGFLARLYTTLYEGRNLRIDSAKRAAERYMKELP